MKQLIFILFLLPCTLFANAKRPHLKTTHPLVVITYYVDATGGNDGNLGTSTGTAWRTIAKVNSSATAGSIVLFKAGETWRECLTISQNNIKIGTYGTGAKPVITGGVVLSGWVSSGGGVYHTMVSNARNALNMVTINGKPQEVGRYPNSDQANGGYLLASAYSGNTTVTAAGLDTLNWTGAEIVRRVYGYLIERERITSQSGTTVTYSKTIKTINPNAGGTGPSTAPIAIGFGNFVQRDLRTLDKFGEWFFDSTSKVLSMYFGGASPASYTVQASTLDTLVNCTGKSGVTISGLDIENANVFGIFYDNSPSLTIRGNTINNSGAKAIMGWYSQDNIIDSLTINWALCSAVDVRSGTAPNITITNSSIKNIALYKGMSSFSDPADGVCIYAGPSIGALVRYNNIDSCGGNAIRFDGFNCNIWQNSINHYGFIRNDGGAIYAFRLWNANFDIWSNIIRNSMDANAGTNEQNNSQGIYMDGGEGLGKIRDNTITNIGGTGYQAGFAILLNSPKIIVVTGNKIFNSSGWYNGRQYTDSSFSLTVKNNQVYVGTGQMAWLYTHSGLDATTRYTSTSIGDAMAQMGTIDSNIYNNSSSSLFNYYYKTLSTGGFTTLATVNLSSIQSLSSQEPHTKITNLAAAIYSNPTNADTTITFTGLSYKDPADTVYNNSLTLRAWDSKILIPNGTVSGNIAPVANAGTNITITLPITSASLNGSGSDADGSITAYSWTQTAGPNTAVISNSAAASTGISGLVAGTYTFLLTVTDNNTPTGATGTSSVTVTVYPVFNNPPTANAGADASVTLPANSISITGSGTDTDGTVTGYLWEQTAGATAAIATPGSATTLFTMPAAGIYKFRLTVTDNGGKVGIDEVQITVVQPVTSSKNFIITNKVFIKPRP